MATFDLDRKSVSFGFAVALAVENLVEKLGLPRRRQIPVILRGWTKEKKEVEFMNLVPRAEFYENARRMKMGRIQDEQAEILRERAAKAALQSPSESTVPVVPVEPPKEPEVVPPTEVQPQAPDLSPTKGEKKKNDKATASREKDSR